MVDAVKETLRECPGGSPDEEELVSRIAHPIAPASSPATPAPAQRWLRERHPMQALDVLRELLPAIRCNRVTGIHQVREARQVGQCDPDRQLEGQA